MNLGSLSGAGRPTPSLGSPAIGTPSAQVRELLSNLGISADKVRVSTEPGGKSQIQSGVQFIQDIHIDSAKMQMLRNLGLTGSPVQMALAVYGGETLKKLKNSLREIEESIDESGLPSETLKEIAKALGIQNPEAFVFVTEDGGLSLLSQIKDSIN